MGLSLQAYPGEALGACRKFQAIPACSHVSTLDEWRRNSPCPGEAPSKDED